MIAVHAHWLLIGGVLTTLYGIIFQAFAIPETGLARAQFMTHHIGTAVVAVGSVFLYGTSISHTITGPIAGVASAVVLGGAVLMTILFIRTND